MPECPINLSPSFHLRVQGCACSLWICPTLLRISLYNYTMLSKNLLPRVLFAILIAACHSQLTYYSMIDKSVDDPTILPSVSRTAPHPQASPKPPQPLVGSWVVTSVAGYSTRIPATISSETIVFKYCNTHIYHYQVSNQKIKVQGGPSSRMLCLMLNPPGQYEVTDTILSASSWELSSGTLTLKNNKDQAVATLTKSLIPIIGNWTATHIKRQTVNFLVSISATNISYRYCDSNTIGYVTNLNNIILQQLVQTGVECQGMSPTQKEVDQAFQNAKTFEVNGGTLTLFDSRGTSIVTMVSRSAPLAGTWTIVFVNNVSTPDLLKTPVLIDGSSMALKYCNNKSFTYRRNRNDIKIEMSASTQMQCDGLHPPQSEVDSAFASAKTYMVDRNILTLYGEDGRMKVVLKK